MINSAREKTDPWLDVIVVDARPADYVEMAARLAAQRVSFRFARTADDALRMAKHSPRAVWLINVCLPDMPGSELFSLLRERDPQLASYFVGEWYRAEDELQCRMSGAQAYVCKPAVADWLLPWLKSTQMANELRPVAISAAG